MSVMLSFRSIIIPPSFQMGFGVQILLDVSPSSQDRPKKESGALPLIRFKRRSLNDLGAYAIDHCRNRRVSLALNHIEGDRRFGRIITADGDPHALDSLAQEFSKMCFFDLRCAVDLSSGG